jgi:hypothetical protein
LVSSPDHDQIIPHSVFLDVTELNADPLGQTVDGQLIVDADHSYSDLDELIVNHVQAMARRVEELMEHEKFKQGSEDDLRESETHSIWHCCSLYA